MRVIVRLLLRLAILVAAAVVIVIVSVWAAEASADPTTPELGRADVLQAPAPARVSPMPAALHTCPGPGASTSGRADPARVPSTGAARRTKE
jgi:hypothetical protein